MKRVLRRWSFLRAPSSQLGRRRRLRLESLEQRRLLSVSALARESPPSCTGSGELTSAACPLGPLPAYFEPNVGQATDGVDFFSRGVSYMLGVDDGDAVLALLPSGAESGQVIRMSFTNGGAPGAGVGVERLTGASNYFRGDDPAQWFTDVPHYAAVSYEDVYPGIDVVYYGADTGELEYDLRLDSGIDPGVITLSFAGAEGLSIDAEGRLIVETGVGQIVQSRPTVYQESAYQETAAERQCIDGRFVVVGDNQVGFELATYDATRPLVIDPKIVFSTYLGGSQTGNFAVTGYDTAEGVAVGDDGKIYVTGWTTSANFPTTPGAFDGLPLNGEVDAFVLKFNSVANLIDYATFLGGSSSESSSDIAVDAMGNVYVTGHTLSHNFPVTPGAFTTVAPTGGNIFVTKINAAGSALAYSTYLGSSASEEYSSAIVVDATGHAFVAGTAGPTTGPVYFPTTAGALFESPFHTALHKGFVVKFNPAGSGLVYGTMLGGLGHDYIADLAINAAGEAYVVGYTSTNSSFPATPGALQVTAPPQADFTCGNSNVDGVTLVKNRQWNGFVTKLNAVGSNLVFSTYLGGGIDTQALSVALDLAGNVYVTGYTELDCYNPVYWPWPPYGFPVTDKAERPGSLFKGRSPDVWKSPWNDFDVVLYAQRDAFLTVFSFAGQLLYSQRLGGSGSDIGREIAVDSLGNVYLALETTSLDLQTVKPIQAQHSLLKTSPPYQGYNSDLFVVCAKPVLVPTVGVVDPQELKWATYLGGSVPAPGALGVAPETVGGMAVGLDRRLHLVGRTSATDFPVVAAYAPTFLGGGADAFVVKIDTDQGPVPKSKHSLWATTEESSLVDSVGHLLLVNPHEILQLTVEPDESFQHAIYFDGRDVGLSESGEDIDAFTVLPDGGILISTAGIAAVPGADGTIVARAHDLLLFTPTSLGDDTAGVWSLYFRGGAVGMPAESNIDAVSTLPDGRLIVSTSGLFALSPDSVASDHDLVAFTPIALGYDTAGTWSPYLEGSAIGLSDDSEGIDAVFVDWTSHTGQPTLYLSTHGAFDVPGLAGTGDDVFVFNPSQLGAAAEGVFSSALALDSGAVNLAGLNVRGYRDAYAHAEPQLDIGGDGALGNYFTSNFAEGGLSAAVVSPDTTLVDPDGRMLDQATAWINRRFDGENESLSVDVSGTAIVASFDAARGVLTLSGGDTLDHYRQVLASLRYANDADRPTGSSRDIRIVLGSGGEASLPMSGIVQLEATNDPPTVDLNGPLPGLDRQLTYSPGSGFLTLPDATLTVGDPDANLVTTDVYVVDRSSPGGPAIVRISPTTGEQSIVSAGGLLADPRAIVEAPDGSLFVADEGDEGNGAVLRIQLNGTQEMVASGAHLLHPYALALAEDGMLYVAAESIDVELPQPAIVQVDPATGASSVLYSSQEMRVTGGMAFDRLGRIVVTAELAAGQPAVLTVDPTTSELQLVASGGLLVQPQGVCVGSSGNYYVADAETSGGGGAVIRISAEDGEQALVAAGGYFTDPVSVAFSGDSELVVLDAGAIPGAGGALIQIDGETLTQTILSQNDLLALPQGLALHHAYYLYGASAELSGATEPWFESLQVDTLGSAIEANYDTDSGVLTLSGAAPLDDYRHVLASLSYLHSGAGLGTGSRQVQVFASDGLVDSLPAIVQIEAPPTAQPDIDLSSFVGAAIPNGDASPTADKTTDFGDTPLTTGAVSRTFVITNFGFDDLSLTGAPRVQIVGPAAGDFQVTVLPPTTVLARTNTTFQVTFNPSALGLRTALVSIASDDPDESPYTFAVQGQGGADVPDIDLSSFAGVAIPNGDTAPTAGKTTEFGNAAVDGGRVSRLLVITNFGYADLVLNGVPRVQVSGAAAGDFQVTTLPPAIVPARTNTTFEIAFDPTGIGLRTALITIANDDPDESPYSFIIQGTGTPGSGASDIDLSSLAGVPIANGDMTPSAAETTQFGSVRLGGEVLRTFVITNFGYGPLTLSGTPRVQIVGPGAADFKVTDRPPTTVAARTNTTFRICFSPRSPGQKNATVRILSNDPDENPYEFSIQGTGAVAAAGAGWSALSLEELHDAIFGGDFQDVEPAATSVPPTAAAIAWQQAVDDYHDDASVADEPATLAV